MKNPKTISMRRTISTTASVQPCRLSSPFALRTGAIIARNPNHLAESTRRFLRGLLVLVLALSSLIALGARAQSNYPASYYFNTFAGNAFGGNGTGSQA